MINKSWDSLEIEIKADMKKETCSWSPIKRGCIPLSGDPKDTIFWLVPCYGYIDMKGKLRKADDHAMYRLVFDSDVDLVYKCKSCQIEHRKNKSKSLQIRLCEGSFNDQMPLRIAAQQARYIIDHYKNNLDGEEVAQLIDIIDRYRAQKDVLNLK